MKDLYANSSKSYIYKMFVVVQYCPYNFMTLLREVADRMCLVLRKKEETKIREINILIWIRVSSSLSIDFL
jgi:hypothetical protein